MSYVWTALSFLLLFCGKARASGNTVELQIRHQEPTMVERGTPFELSFTVPGINPRDIKDAYVCYRPGDQIAYVQRQAVLSSSEIKARLKIEDKQATSVEYYLEIQMNSGEEITFPKNDAAANPVRVEVVDQRKTERERRVEATGVDYTILSPNPESTVAPNDVVLALTLFYDPADIDTAHTSFRMLLDNKDISADAHASNYFYTYSPDKLMPGKHTVSFSLQKPDTALEITEWKFTVLDPNEVLTSGSSGNGSSWMPKGRVQLTARDQQVGEYANNALSGNITLSGHQGNISYAAHGFITSQEDPRLQTQNRFGGRLEVGNWLELQAGHVYPNLSLLTIAGQRMNGINAALHIWNDAVNLHFIHGRLRRGIDNIYGDLEPEVQMYQGTAVDTTYALNIDDRGTFERKVTGGRLGLGRGKRFRFGLNFLKVQDDTNSIDVIRGYKSLNAVSPQLMQSLNSGEQQDLAANPNQLSISGNPSPKGNVVASSDLELSFDSDRIRFRTNGGLSLLNRDISGGVLTRQKAEDLGLEIDQSTEDLLDRLSWLIVINQNIDALPLRFDTGENGTMAQPFFPTSIIASRSEMGLHYFNNDFQLRYRWVGPNYNSLANTTIRKDIAGYTLSDRFRLYDDRIYITFGYERLQDNVTESKDATTHTTTYRGNISWYPIDPDLPRLSVSIMNRNRENGIALNNPYLSSSLQDAAVQNFRIQQGDTLIAPHPRLSNSYQLTSSVTQRFSVWGINNDASVSYSHFTTIDKKFGFGDTKSNSFSMRVINRFPDLPLQTNFGFNLNHTASGGGQADVRIIGVYIGGSLFLLNNKLNLNASLAFTKNKSRTIPLLINNNGTAENYDDYYQPDEQATSLTKSNSYIVSAGLRYNLTVHHSFLLDFRYSNVRDVLSTRAIPNDHLLQARYIFNF
jgi:hypothetical protein